MAYFVSFHGLSYELEQVTSVLLIIVVSHFPILEKNVPQSHLIINKSAQNSITYMLKYFNNFLLIPFIYTPPTDTHLFPNTPIINNKRVLIHEMLKLLCETPNLFNLVASSYF